MDNLRQRLLEKKLGGRLHWKKPEITETVGPYNPTAFDLYEAQLAEAIDLLRERLEAYTDEQIAIITGEELDPEGLRNEWRAFLESGRDKRLREPPPWYAGGFGHPDHRADFEYWCKMPSLSIPEATCLSVGINPAEFDERELKRLLSESDRSRFWPAVQYLLKRYDLLFRKFYTRVGSERFIIWAEQVDLEMPPEFRRLLSNYHLPSDLRKQQGSQASGPDKREIDKIAQLFAAIAIDAYGYDPKQSRSPIPKEITELSAAMGLQTSTETVRKYLKIGTSFIPEDWEPK